MKKLFLAVVLCFAVPLTAQETEHLSHSEIRKARAFLASHLDPHHHKHPFRVDLLIGHAFVPEAQHEGMLFVPTWGIDVDYHLSNNWSLGWHSDIELENYLIVEEDNNTYELVTPVVTTIDVFYRLSNNVLIGIGPGITQEHGEMKTLMRVGIEGEVPMNDRWEWTPTLYLDQRIDGHQVWTFAVGVAHYL